MSPELQALKAINQTLEETPVISRRELQKMGVIEADPEPVFRVGAPEGEAQALPFTKMRLPIAHTGILEPKKAVDESHKALQILLPGAGTTFSVAQTMCDVAGTFHGRKSKNRGKGRKSSQSIFTQLTTGDEPFRVASFPTDLPLNGMGSAAPFEFADEEGLMTVLRHVHLVLSRLYPDRPVFMGGRSQGGIASILYAQHYDDLRGAIAVNPPHPDPELFKFTVDYLEGKADQLAELLHVDGVSLHEQSWKAYKTFTPNFNYPGRQCLAPVLTLVSLGDTFNLFPKYAEKQQEFADGDGKCNVHILDAGHNLWSRKDAETYERVIKIQVEFILRGIETPNQN